MARSKTIYSVHIVFSQFSFACFQSARVSVLTLDLFTHSCLSQDEFEKHISMQHEYHPMVPKHPARPHQFGEKGLLGLFMGYALRVGRNQKGQILTAVDGDDKTTLPLETCRQRPDHLVESSTEGQSLSANEKLQLDNARTLRGVYLFDPVDPELK